VLTAYAPGEKEIPPVKLSFFNPDKKTYETVATQPIKVNITGEAALREQDLPYNGEITKIGSDINYNKNLTGIKSYCGYFVENKKFYFLFIPFLLLFAVSAFYRVFKNRNATRPYDSKKPSLNVALKYLERASGQAGRNNADAFIAYIYKALEEAVCAKTGIAREALSAASAEKALKERGFADAAAKTREAFSRIEFFRFASIKADSHSMEDLDRLAGEIISDLRK
jgi:hypothetical protein